MLHEVRETDAIHIEELELRARVGVPAKERAKPQRLVMTITFWPTRNFAALNDDIARTIDYVAVAQEVRRFVQTRTDRLIETLADAVAAHLLSRFPVRAARIELRKFVIAKSAYVAVIVTRRQARGRKRS